MANWNPEANDIFLRAVEIAPTGERLAYLAQTCGENAELRAQVEALLAASAKVGSFLEHPADPYATGAFAPASVGEDLRIVPTQENVGDQVGPYKLLQKLGEGGMGTVWVAEQQQPVKRRVAVKVIKAGMDSAQVLRRFEAERQALALMDHTNIAKVLDAGKTASGRPYFAMELVPGVPIQRYCDELHLTVRERLELFLPVCRAIQHAHQKGIIHRDIKPSNVLVSMQDGKPVAKVIDFGVAKALSQQLTERTMYTEIGAVIGTLEYMAPEQAEMSPLGVDTRSDIYSLGVLLYELLTGTTPLDKKRLRSAAFAEMLRMIKEEEPPRPSTRLTESKESLASLAVQRRTEPARLTKEVRGELDWIVMKCLEKDRTRRYETANGLARDIQRYLADEAVEASPPSATYRLRKFVRRHKGPVLAASLILLALLAGMAGTTWGLFEAKRSAEAERLAKVDALEKEKLAVEQRTKAEKARNRTRDVLDAMTTEVTGVSLSSQKEISAEQKKFLTEVLTYYREFAGEKADDEQSRVRTANAAGRVGLIEYRLGRHQQAMAALQMARDGYRTLTTDFPTVPNHQRELAACYNSIGILLAALEKPAEAEEQLRQALAIAKKLAADFPTLPKYRGDLAASQDNLGNLLKDLERRTEAQEQYRQALAIWEKLATAFPAFPEYRRELAGSHYNLGILLDGLGKLAEAQGQYRQALDILAKLADAFPAMPDLREQLASSHNKLGMVLASLGKPAEAQEQNRQALAIQEKLTADFPGMPNYRRGPATSHNNLGILLKSLGKPAEAEAQYRQALAILEKLATDFPATPDYQRRLANIHGNLGLLLADLGKLAEAEGQYRQALAIWEKLAADCLATPHYRKDLAVAHNNLGLVLASLRQGVQAEQQYRKALAIQEKLADAFPAVPDYRQGLARSHYNLGLLLKSLGKPAEAEAQFRKATAIFEKLAADVPATPDYRQELAQSHRSLGNLQAGLEKRAEAQEQYRQALAIQEKLAVNFPAVPAHRQELASIHYNLGNLLAGLGKRAEAQEQYRQVIDIQEKLGADFPAVPVNHVELGGSYCNYGLLVLRGGRASESLGWFDKAIATLAQVHRAEPRNDLAKQFLRNSYWNRALAFDALTKNAEAVRDWDRAIELSTQQEQPQFRSARAASQQKRAARAAYQLKAGMVAEAVAEVSELTKDAIWTANQWYEFACVYAVASGKIADKKQEYADRAMELLHKAAQAGFKDATHMKQDKDLVALREREDFKKLLAEVEGKAEKK